MLRDREDAGLRLAARFQGRSLRDPLVLAIPRGGVVTGAALARELGAELDVVLSRKLRAPRQPELAIGAITEDGQVFLNPEFADQFDETDRYLADERQHQLSEIERRKHLFRNTRPQAPIGGRSVIVTDDGLATGATMIAALQTVRARKPHELIVAVPVASPSRLDEVSRWCDDVICLIWTEHFMAVGQFYDDFRPIEDDEAVRLLLASSRVPL